MKTASKSLDVCPLFSGIDSSDLGKLLPCLGARTVHFDKKSTVFSEGDAANTIGIMLKGSAQTVQIDYYGNRVILGKITDGEIFGEEFACAETSELPVSVVANEPCEIMLIDCSHVLHTCCNNCAFHQQLIYNLMRDLATKNISLHNRIEITSKRTTREKLLAYLTLMQKKTGKTAFEVPFDRQELADYLEVDRSGLSSEISKLKNEGVIENTKNRFKLL